MASTPDLSGNTDTDQSLDNNRFTITPSDTLPLKAPVDVIVADVGGVVRCGVGSQPAVDYTLTANEPLFVGQVSRIYATGTTATGIKGLASRALR